MLSRCFKRSFLVDDSILTVPILSLLHVKTQEFKAKKPVVKTVSNMLLPRFLQKLCEGDHSLEADLLTAAESKDDQWVPRQNSCNLVVIKSFKIHLSELGV